MRIVQWIVCAGLVLSGLFLAAGEILEKGNLSGLGVYVGWFFAAYSILAYVIGGLLSIMRGSDATQHHLIAFNLGLTFLGIASFGITSTSRALGAGIAILAGLAVVAFLHWRKALHTSYDAAVIIVLAALPLIEGVRDYWAIIYVALGVAVVASHVLARPRL